MNSKELKFKKKFIFNLRFTTFPCKKRKKNQYSTLTLNNTIKQESRHHDSEQKRNSRFNRLLPFLTVGFDLSRTDLN